MLLVVDIGNTDTVFGFFEGEKLQFQTRILSKKDETDVFFEYKLKAFMFENSISTAGIKKAIISSVVPDLTVFLKNVVSNIFYIEPLIMQPYIYKGLTYAIDNPSEIGSDLVANAVYAFHHYKQNCIIVDFGTALTFTTVSAEGMVLGVSIVPGLKTAIKALFSNTAQLPEVPLALPDSAIGKNTITAIQAGIIFGYEGLVKNMIARIRAELGGNCIAIATGGLASIISTLKDDFEEVNILLTMQGLRIIAEQQA
jgi:type III pantothenate kinase